MKNAPLKLLILGAHPDDAEWHAGGLVARYCAAGHDVKIVSVTDGRSGHQTIPPDELAALRKQEAAAAGSVIGATYDVWEFPDGSLQPTLDVRRKIIAQIRQFAPDLVLTHRVNDYHPDHRAVGQAVQDASYMVTVPHVVPEVPALRHDPIVAYMPDRFTKPNPLTGDIVIDVGEQVEIIVAMLACHKSQVFDWLPYNLGISDQLSDDLAERLQWLSDWYREHLRPMADRYRDELLAAYGEQRGRAIEYAEVYEISEYAGTFDEAARQRLFGWLSDQG
ncbi:Mycothiol S-conjugate amidase [Symmachiella dynata]|uniref:Mycothiol S-conjugate amidase n=1 Tax=Symmachiella dynata TaxID=2527995 RepID=A0A517ZW89_9PLAN|nr:PIG-L deacetylase family protein [Symmachiella dynata]QDU46718.1 Mycothiol S-conjugate amidase [Symmachiella dynata]